MNTTISQLLQTYSKQNVKEEHEYNNQSTAANNWKQNIKEGNEYNNLSTVANIFKTKCKRRTWIQQSINCCKHIQNKI